MTKLNKSRNKNQHSRQVTNHYDFSHAIINIGSNNRVVNHVEIKKTQSLGLGAEKDKKQSFDWRKASEIIVAILKVIAQLLVIAPPLFNMLC